MYYANITIMIVLMIYYNLYCVTSNYNKRNVDKCRQRKCQNGTIKINNSSYVDFFIINYQLSLN